MSDSAQDARDQARETIAEAADQASTTPDPAATPKVEGDETRALGGATSGERDYVAVSTGGVTGEEHNPTPDEEIGREGSVEAGRGLRLETQGEPLPGDEKTGDDDGGAGV